ncbi:MAG: CHAD domain-containing protein [Verrucomicrobia bacterium]|nr:CHAD domain-containing protein [Verrucomicrobiota bacterium]
MKTLKFFHRWKRRHEKLLARLSSLLRQCRTDGEAEQVHQLRVALRRLRLTARVGRACLGRAVEREFYHWSREVSDSISRVRDLDVALEWLQQHAASAPAIERVARWRQRRWKAVRTRLEAPPARLAGELDQVAGHHSHRNQLLAQHRRLRAKVEGRIAEELPRFFRLKGPQQHEFRRALRRLRFLRELELPRKRQSADVLLKLLVALHEGLGRLQNSRVYEQLMKRLGEIASNADLQRALLAGRRHDESLVRRHLQHLKRFLKPTTKDQTKA